MRVLTTGEALESMAIVNEKSNRRLTITNYNTDTTVDTAYLKNIVSGYSGKIIGVQTLGDYITLFVHNTDYDVIFSMRYPTLSDNNVTTDFVIP